MGVSQFYQTFSGTDTLAFIILPDSKPIVLGSLTTASYSMYRNKKPVINIGRTRINGVTRGSRIFAGTLVFTVINQHWLEEIKKEIAWLSDFDDLKADELPLFDIMIVSANEYGNSVSMYVYGIDFTDEAQTISVQDLFTENVFSFVARDVSTFKAGEIFSKKSGTNKDNAKIDLSNGIRNYNFDEADIQDQNELERLYQEKHSMINKAEEKDLILTRSLYFSASKTMIGNDVIRVQELLKKYIPDINVNGVFDKSTELAVKRFQSLEKLEIDGVITQKEYDFLVESIGGEAKKPAGLIINKSGARVFREAEINSDIVDFIPFNTTITIDDILETDHKYYKINSGYILEQDVYNYFDEKDVYEFPPLKEQDVSSGVTVLQNMLLEVYKDVVLPSIGVFDSLTKSLVKRLQKDSGLSETGDVNSETWFALREKTGKSIIDSSDGIFLTYNCPPGTYNMTTEELINTTLFDAIIGTKQPMATKMAVIKHYKNGASKVNSKVIQIKEDTNLMLNDFQPYLYTVENGVPEKIEYFIVLYNKTTYKWIINITQ